MSQIPVAPAAEATQSKTTLDVIAKRIQEVFSLPDVAMRVLEVVSNSKSSVSDLRSVVESDPALVSRLLRTINSSAYGLRSRVDSVHRAIALLGFNEIKNLVTTASVAELLKDENRVGCYTRTGLWKHLVSVGLVSRLVASRCGLDSFEKAYMCGLLHDIGITFIDQHLHQPFEQIISHICAEVTTSESEQQVLGFDHAQLGAKVAEKWGFPAIVIDAIRYHHQSDKYGGDDREIVCVVEVANFLCSKKGVTSVGMHNVRPPSSETFEALGIGRNDLKVIWSNLDDELQKLDDFVKI